MKVIGTGYGDVPAVWIAVTDFDQTLKILNILRSQIDPDKIRVTGDVETTELSAWINDGITEPVCHFSWDGFIENIRITFRSESELMRFKLYIPEEFNCYWGRCHDF